MDCARIYAASLVCTVWVAALLAGADPESTLLPASIALGLAFAISVQKYIEDRRSR